MIIRQVFTATGSGIAKTTLKSGRDDAFLGSLLRTLADRLSAAMFFRFPPDAGWNPDRNAFEFGIGVGDYEGVVRVSRRVPNPAPRGPHALNDASKPTIFIGRGSNSSPSGRFVAAG
jgi:hypothetical protein